MTTEPRDFETPTYDLMADIADAHNGDTTTRAADRTRDRVTQLLRIEAACKALAEACESEGCGGWAEVEAVREALKEAP